MALSETLSFLPLQIMWSWKRWYYPEN